jgi:hypothetical protein
VVSDALPLLRKSSSEVTIVEIVEDEADRAAALLRVEDVAAGLFVRGIAAGARTMWRCRHATGASSIGRRRRRGYCRRLWPLKAERLDPRGRDATAHHGRTSEPTATAAMMAIAIPFS